MLSLTVQTLDGHTLQAEVDPAGCVKDVRKHLAERYGLSKCALYLQAQQLSMKTLLAELNLVNGARLTALTTLGSSVPAQAGRQQRPAAPLSPVGSPGGRCSAMAQQNQLDTLLPGYASRPNPSPVKAHKQQQQQHRHAADGVSQLCSAQTDHALQRQQHAVAAGAAADQAAADLPSSLIDFEVAPAVVQDYSEAVAAAAGLSNGGFIMSGDGVSQQAEGGRAKPELIHAPRSAPGEVPRHLAGYSGSRKKEGRTLLQQHMMMQHDLKQQQLLAAQCLKRQQQQQQQQQGVAVQQMAADIQPAAECRECTSDQQPGIKVEALEQDHLNLQPHAAPTGVNQQEQQQQQVSDEQPAVAYESWLHQPGSLARPQQTILSELALPAVLDQLLLLHSRLDVCYTFLLQQRIQPRWGRLQDMMRQLFPQGPNVALHHLMLMAQLAPQAVLLLLPPPPQQQQQQEFGEQVICLGDEIPWPGTLSDPEVVQLQQGLQDCQTATADTADTDCHAAAPAGGQRAAGVEAAGRSAMYSRNSSAAGLPSAASALVCGGVDVRDLVVLLVDPGPQGRRNTSSTATGGKSRARGRERRSAAAAAAAEDVAAATEDEDEEQRAAAGACSEGGADTGGDERQHDLSKTTAAAAGDTAAPGSERTAAGLQERPAARCMGAQQQYDSSSSGTPGSQTVSLSARYGSGSKVASARRQRLMRLCAAAAVWLLHQQFVTSRHKQRSQCPPQQKQKQPAGDQGDKLAAEGGLVNADRSEPEQAGGVSRQPAAAAAAQTAAACTASGGGRPVRGRKRRLALDEHQQEEEQGHEAAEAGLAAGRRCRRRPQHQTLQQKQHQGMGTEEEQAAAVVHRRAEGDATLAAGKAPSKGRGTRSSRRNRTAECCDTAAEHLGMGDTSGSSVGSWDPLLQHTWHPDFSLEGVLLQDLLSAVGKHRTWWSCQQQQQQMPAAGSSAGVAAAAPRGGGSSVVLARPTRTMARNKSCTSCEVLSTVQFLDHLKTLSWHQGQVVHVQNMPAREPRYCSTTRPLTPSTRAALSARGIQQLFIHQASAVDALCCKQKHVVIATSTASGKSLCYNIPMLEALAQDPHACGLLMFPTKALAQDQLRVLRQLMQDAFGAEAPCVEVYDGDTPHVDRADIRERAQLLITNPDMLHQSILPCHKNFARLLTKLAYVVVDEGHAYRGVFGCHTALVLRRLRRVCVRCYGSRPKVVVTSATIANPLEHATLLLGVSSDELLLVDEDGSPHGSKQFVMWNPPLTWDAQQAAAAGEAAGVMSRTEMRGGSLKLQREIARTLVRESTAARRRGVALSAAAGVSEEEWAAAVRLGAAGTAAKAFLFNHPAHSPAIAGAVAAAAGSPKGAVPAPHGRYIELQEPQEHMPQRNNRQEQQQVDTRKIEAAQASKGLARDALAAVAAAANATSGNRQQQQVARAPTPIVRPLPNPLQGLTAGGNNPPGGGSNSNRNNRRSCRVSSAVTAEVQREIEEALPSRGSFKEKFGAAGTPLDQRRESPIVEMSLLLTEAVMHGLRTIAFCKSRKLCELVAAYTRENLKAAAPHKANMVKVYRGGYSPAERRQLEADLHSGALTAVAATNALELGIDVGQLDLTLHLGFPGSVASLWQQAGRAGRRKQSSLSLYVGFDGPLDQHFMKHPGELFQRPIECVQLDPCNALVMNSHLVCAAKELPLLQELDGPLFGPPQLAAAIETLTAASLVGRHPHDPVGLCAMHYVGKCSNPASEISLRTIDPERFIIYNTADNSVLEEIESNMAFYEIYDGAIYLFQGHPFICTALNLETRVAYVKPVDVRWYTKVRDHTDIHVTGGHVAYPTAHAALAAIAARRALAGPVNSDPAGAAGTGFKREADLDRKCAVSVVAAAAGHAGAVKQEVKVEEDLVPARAAADGDSRVSDASPFSHAVCESCVITVRFMGYFRVHQGSGKVFDAIDLFLPDTQFETQATCLRLPSSARRACQAADIPFREAVHAASHALLNVLPLYMVCNSTDMGTECDNPYDTRFRPERLLLYDKHPGGIGLAAQATPLFPELLQRALDLVQNCSCPYTKGCPCCVQHLDCKNYNAVLNKAGGLLVLKAVLGHKVELTEEAGNDRENEAAPVAG